jgi:hypothetical protein
MCRSHPWCIRPRADGAGASCPPFAPTRERAPASGRDPTRGADHVEEGFRMADRDPSQVKVRVLWPWRIALGCTGS